MPHLQRRQHRIRRGQYAEPEFESAARVALEIAKLRHVCAVYDVTGEEDSIVISKFKSREELSNFAKEVLALPHVERTNTHVVLNTTKEDFRSPFILD